MPGARSSLGAPVFSPGLVLGLALVLIGSSCGGRVDPPADAGGAQVYELQNCRNCHGANGEGNALGPPLAKLQANWSRDELVAFLTDPAPVLESNERVRALAKAYPAQMSRYDNLSPEQLGELADWLLARHP